MKEVKSITLKADSIEFEYDRPKNKIEVTDDGIYEDLGNGYSRRIMSREVFVEAFEKWIGGKYKDEN